MDLNQSSPVSHPVRFSRVGWVIALFCLELLVLAALYQFFTQIECQQTGLNGLCRFLRSLVARGLVVFAAFALLVWARPRDFAAFVQAAAEATGRRNWLHLHLGGLVLLLLPLFLAPHGDLSAVFGMAVWPLIGGAVAASWGGFLWMAPRAAWRGLLSLDHYAPLFILALAGLLPDIADLALPLWDWQLITRLTFTAVQVFLGLFADEVHVDAPGYVIGLEHFRVHIARQCSGVEGVALVTAFTGLYAFIFRETVRFPHIWLVLPVAIALSWLLNVVRVGGLILIGAHVSPNLAVNGFHSYAGWVFFTALALAIVFAVQATPWLHRQRVKAQALPLWSDPLAMALLPFAMFMLASLVTHAAFPHPELGYPLRVLVLVLVVWLFRAQYLAMDWRPDPVAIMAGIMVGIGWLWLDTSPPDAGQALAVALGGLSGWILAIWIVTRIVGTVLLVPLVEEMFFRGYLLARLDGPGLPHRLMAVAISSAIFAALHGRWLTAGLAGIVFALVMLRRGRVTDAVFAHMIANLIIAVWAFATSDFAKI